MPWYHLLIQVVLLAGFAALGWGASKGRPTAIAGLVAGVLIALMDVWMNERPDLFLALLPFADALFYDNWLPFGCALFGGSALHFAQSRGQRIRVAVLLFVLLIVACRPTRDYYLPLAEATQDWVDADGVVRQSSGETCTAAALATLARHYGEPADEKMMIERARTRRGKGTTKLGVHRALKITFSHREDLSPRVVNQPLEWLLQRNRPALITVGLPKGSSPEAQDFGARYDWPIDRYHDVVFLGRDTARPGYVLIAEPDYGRESWPVEHLRYLYSGFAAVVE